MCFLRVLLSCTHLKATFLILPLSRLLLLYRTNGSNDNEQLKDLVYANCWLSYFSLITMN
jgi:hypothetical protein